MNALIDINVFKYSTVGKDEESMHEDPKARALATLGALSLYFSGILETH